MSNYGTEMIKFRQTPSIEVLSEKQDNEEESLVIGNDGQKNVSPQKSMPKSKPQFWSQEETSLLFELHQKFGNKWTKIAKCLKGKTECAIKNFFYCRIKKAVRMLSMEIIDDKIRSDIVLLDQILYIMNYLKDFYLIPIEQDKVSNIFKKDKYIKKIISQNNLTSDKINHYIEILNSIRNEEKTSKIFVQETSESHLKPQNYSSADRLGSDKSLTEFDLKSISYSLPLPFNMFNPKFVCSSNEYFDFSFLIQSSQILKLISLIQK